MTLWYITQKSYTGAAMIHRIHTATVSNNDLFLICTRHLSAMILHRGFVALSHYGYLTQSSAWQLIRCWNIHWSVHILFQEITCSSMCSLQWIFEQPLTTKPCFNFLNTLPIDNESRCRIRIYVHWKQMFYIPIKPQMEDRSWETTISGKTASCNPLLYNNLDKCWHVQ